MKKFLKGYCKKIKQYFFLSLEKEGSEYQVENMTHMSEEDAKKVTSIVTQPKFITRSHLLPCSQCGSRVISGCNCAPSITKCKKGQYRFDCIYCENMELDYSSVATSTGEIIMGQNETIDLSKICPPGEKMEKVTIAGGWDPVSFGKDADIDFSVIMVKDNGGMETVYFGHKDDEARSIHHHGDNLTGKTGYVSGLVNDDEVIDVNLNRIPREFSKLFFVINVYSGQTFNKIKNIYVRMYNEKRSLLRYNVGDNTFRDKALVVASLVRNGSDWKFNSIGYYNKAEDLAELRVIIAEKYL